MIIEKLIKLASDRFSKDLHDLGDNNHISTIYDLDAEEYMDLVYYNAFQYKEKKIDGNKTDNYNNSLRFLWHSYFIAIDI